MGIDLRGGEAGVAQQLLHAAQVGAGIEQVRGKAVPQGMGRKGWIQTGLHEVFFERSLHRARGEHPAAVIEEQPGDTRQAQPRHQAIPGIQGRLQRLDGGPADGTQPLLLALAAHQRRTRQQIDARIRQSTQFGDAHAGAVEQFQDGGVADGGIVGKPFGGARARFFAGLLAHPGGSLQQAQHFFPAQHLGQAAAGLGLLQARKRIGLHQSFAHEETEKGAQARHLAAGGGGRLPRLLERGQETPGRKPVGRFPRKWRLGFLAPQLQAELADVRKIGRERVAGGVALDAQMMDKLRHRRILRDGSGQRRRGGGGGWHPRMQPRRRKTAFRRRAGFAGTHRRLLPRMTAPIRRPRTRPPSSWAREVRAGRASAWPRRSSESARHRPRPGA
jgi:hypothetical protein